MTNVFLASVEAFVRTKVWFIQLLFLCAATIIWSNLPSSLWYELNMVHVDDAHYRAPITMKIDREIKRDFFGLWTVTVFRRGGYGFYSYCTSQGARDYAKDAVLPDVVTLEWWMDDSTCTLVPGTYKVRTLVRIQPMLAPERQVRMTSNTFEIRQPGAN